MLMDVVSGKEMDEMLRAIHIASGEVERTELLAHSARMLAAFAEMLNK